MAEKKPGPSWMHLVAILGVLVLGACAAPRNGDDEGGGTLPEVTLYLQQHPEFGAPVATEDVPGWAKGERQRIRFDSGRSLVFYTKGDSVVTVYEDRPDEGRVKIWGEYEEPEDFTPADREADAELPAYIVLSSAEYLGGRGRFGDVLVPSFSRAMPASERESFARRIAETEGLINLSLYSTQEAYEANVSASFASSHPHAMREGFLGMLDDGKFTPGEALYP